MCEMSFRVCVCQLFFVFVCLYLFRIGSCCLTYMPVFQTCCWLICIYSLCMSLCGTIVGVYTAEYSENVSACQSSFQNVSLSFCHTYQLHLRKYHLRPFLASASNKSRICGRLHGEKFAINLHVQSACSIG